MTVKQLGDELIEIRDDVRRAQQSGASEYVGLEGYYADVRLQSVDGDRLVHVGDPCYDADHRGLWACGTVTPDMSKQDCRELARELVRDLT